MTNKSIRPSRFSGVRGVALFEATKGVVVILAGVGLLALVHHDLQATAEHLVTRLHLNPAKHMGRIFVDAATHLEDAHLRTMALLALVYSSMRFIEAYGLWRGRRWAEWFSVVSGAAYVPFEVAHVVRGYHWLDILLLTVNLLIVAYMASVLSARSRSGHPTSR